MSKTLLVLRHAKSDWEAGAADDHERPLAPRGRRAAKSVGRWIAGAGLTPQSVIGSTALRARDTVEIAVREGGWESRLRWSRELYDSSPARILGEISVEPDEVEILLVAGHEPLLSDLVSRLVGGAAIRLPTAAVACVQPFSDRWADLPQSGGQLLWLVPPKLLQKLGF
jgi:phosphohistidine phosphatase